VPLPSCSSDHTQAMLQTHPAGTRTIGCLDGHRAVGYRVKRDPAERQGRPADPKNRPARVLANHSRLGSRFLLTEVNLVGADIGRPEQFRRLAKELRSWRPDGRRFAGFGREIPHPHVIDHSLTQRCHGRLLSREDLVWSPISCTWREPCKIPNSGEGRTLAEAQQGEIEDRGQKQQRLTRPR
jgi:hypothetical protein